jgi:hypothetical protein
MGTHAIKKLTQKRLTHAQTALRWYPHRRLVNETVARYGL